jgi:hypothetical protein
MRILNILSVIAVFGVLVALWVLALVYPVVEKAWLIGIALGVVFSLVGVVGGFRNFLLIVASLLIAIASFQFIDWTISSFGVWDRLDRTSGVVTVINLALIGFAVWLWVKVGNALIAKYGKRIRPENDGW